MAGFKDPDGCTEAAARIKIRCAVVRRREGFHSSDIVHDRKDVRHETGIQSAIRVQPHEALKD